MTLEIGIYYTSHNKSCQPNSRAITPVIECKIGRESYFRSHWCMLLSYFHYFCFQINKHFSERLYFRFLLFRNKFLTRKEDLPSSFIIWLMLFVKPRSRMKVCLHTNHNTVVFFILCLSNEILLLIYIFKDSEDKTSSIFQEKIALVTKIYWITGNVSFWNTLMVTSALNYKQLLRYRIW